MTSHHQTAICENDRKFIAIDIENACGEAYPSALLLGEAFNAALRAASWRVGDHVLIAGNRCLLRDLMFLRRDVASVRRISPPGSDAADRVLLDELALTRPWERFSAVVLVSGDHAFADVAVTCGAAGVHVSVVSLSGCLSAELRAAADSVQLIDLAEIERAADGLNRVVAIRWGRPTPRALGSSEPVLALV